MKITRYPTGKFTNAGQTRVLVDAPAYSFAVGTHDEETDSYLFTLTYYDRTSDKHNITASFTVNELERMLASARAMQLSSSPVDQWIQLNRRAGKIEDAELRRKVYGVLDSGWQNMRDTGYESESNWAKHEFALNSSRGLLCSEEDETVRHWFTNQGFSW